MEILFRVDGVVLVIHSGLRWVILLVAVIAIVRFALGWLRTGESKSIDRGLTSAFSGLMDLQVVLGIINLILMLWIRNERMRSDDIYCAILACFFPTYAVVHGFIMLAAAVVAHIPARWKDIDDTNRFRKSMLATLASLVLVLIGIFVLRFRPELF